VTIGTKSVLFGAHQFLIHPWFVALAWWRLYGFPWDPRLWVAFFVHDLGYIGQPNMDGAEGERHPVFGARLMTVLFDPLPSRAVYTLFGAPCLDRHELEAAGWNEIGERWYGYWGQFTLLHSRYFAKSAGLQPSRLCIADKLAIALTPAWLYLPMVRATGEIREYMAHAKHRAAGNIQISAEELRRVTSASEAEWYAGVQSYCRRWAYEHRDGKADTWTSDARNRAVLNEHGVWQ
jgi:hypothetical protein